MYVSLLLIYSGAGFLFGSIWVLLLIPGVVLAVSRLVIRREELYLKSKFGEEYGRYQSRVRRWL